MNEASISHGFEIIEPYRSISFIGMSKNAGKTTTLNYFIGQTRGKCTLGLSSIGRDGESIDRVTGTKKPRIYITEGTLLATASSCIALSDATIELLEVTSFSTPMGNIVIGRAVSDGFIELAGPSSNSQLYEVMRRMFAFGAQKVMIDGALSRKSLASPAVAESTILATGAAHSKSLRQTVMETIHSYKLLTLPRYAYGLPQNEIGSGDCTCVLDKDSGILYKSQDTIIGHEEDLLNHIGEEARRIYSTGAITDSFVDRLLRNTKKATRLSIIAEDGTKLFISPDTSQRIEQREWELRVRNRINLIAITVNPYSASDYELSSEHMIQELKQRIEIPIFDVKGDK